MVAILFYHSQTVTLDSYNKVCVIMYDTKSIRINSSKILFILAQKSTFSILHTHFSKQLISNYLSYTTYH